MKSLTTTLLMLFSLFAVAQSRYETRKIAKWTLQYFPSAYIVKPHHVKITNKFGRLAYYQEVDINGQPNGITVEMQNNLIYPYTINYYCKGTMVYGSSFFSNSNKADMITNWNLKNEFDGPTIKRTLKENGTVVETKVVFKNGSDSRGKQPQLIYNQDGYLNGDFFADNDEHEYPELYRSYKGRAKNGFIEYYEEKDKNGNGISYQVSGYCVLVKEFYGSRVDTNRKIVRMGKILRVANPDVTEKDYKNCFYFERRTQSYLDLKQILNAQELSDDQIEHFEFRSHMLNGNFISKFYCDAEITGNANDGVIEDVLIAYSTGFYKKIVKNGTKYAIQKLDQNLRVVKSLEFEIVHPVLIVNEDNSTIQSSGDEKYIVKKGFNVLALLFKMIGHQNEITSL